MFNSYARLLNKLRSNAFFNQKTVNELNDCYKKAFSFYKELSIEEREQLEEMPEYRHLEAKSFDRDCRFTALFGRDKDFKGLLEEAKTQFDELRKFKETPQTKEEIASSAD